MKILVVVLLVLFGFYWLVDHTSPFPLNHESFGLYNHTIHRIIGIIFFIGAGFTWRKWKTK